MAFHFRAFWGINVFLVGVGVVVAMLVHGSVLHGDYRGAWFAGCGGAVLCGILLYLNVITCSDLIINDDGIFRRFFGLQFQRTKWSNIKVIVVNKVRKSRFSDERSIINIYQVDPSFFSFRGRIIVGDSIDGYLAFRRILNENITKYGINVRVDDGVSKKSSKILD